MRSAAALPFLAAVVLLTGCAPGSNGELRAVVDDVAPAERDTLGCEWESNWGSGSVTGTGAKAYYRCSWFVPGKLPRVTRGILTRLNAHGFKVACRSDSRTVEFMANRGTTTIDIDVLAKGFVNARAVAPSDVDIPAGSLYVDILAQKHRSVQVFAKPHVRCA
jgi:hypothetical protein